MTRSHRVEPSVFVFVVTFRLGKALGFLLQQLDGVQQVVEGGLGRRAGSILAAQTPARMLLEHGEFRTVKT